MSQFMRVQKALAGNPSITIIGKKTSQEFSWSYRDTNFFVAPKTGGMYTIQELQELMLSLAPNLKPLNQFDFKNKRTIEGFHEYCDWIEFGCLQFCEYVGTKVTHQTITVTDKDALLVDDSLVDGKRIIECADKIQQSTFVLLFPDIRIATAAFKGIQNKDEISISKLAEYREITTRLVKTCA